MTRSPRTPPPASSARDRPRAAAPRPLNSAGRPVDSSGRPVPGQEDSERGGPEPTEWERIKDAGWASERPAAGGPPPTGEAPSLSSLLAVLDALRAIVPRELERQFTTLLRELLLTVRALIDWYLERLDSDERERRVEDIPIE